MTIYVDSIIELIYGFVYKIYIVHIAILCTYICRQFDYSGTNLKASLVRGMGWARQGGG